MKKENNPEYQKIRNLWSELVQREINLRLKMAYGVTDAQRKVLEEQVVIVSDELEKVKKELMKWDSKND